MKIAILWGTVFGVLQAIISIVAGAYIYSPIALTVSCIGSLLSIALALACGLIGTIHAKRFSVGFWAGMIATAISILASLILIAINPSILKVGGTVNMAISFVIVIAYSIVLSAAGAGIGLFISRQFMSSIPSKA